MQIEVDELPREARLREQSVADHQLQRVLPFLMVELVSLLEQVEIEAVGGRRSGRGRGSLFALLRLLRGALGLHHEVHVLSSRGCKQ